MYPLPVGRRAPGQAAASESEAAPDPEPFLSLMELREGACTSAACWTGPLHVCCSPGAPGRAPTHPCG